MLFDHVDRVRIINLAHRADRRAQMLGELRRLGAEHDPKVSFFAARRFDAAGTFSSGGARGCYHSHLDILEEAAAAGASVLIVEDDADFTAAARDFALPPDWQVLYGGYHPADPTNLPASDIIGSHCMGFSADVVPVLASYLRGLLERDDHPPIDGAYVWFRRAHPGVRTVFAVPPLAEQRPSRTDIAPLRFFDRWPVLRSLVGAARRLRRAAARRSFGLREALALAVGAIGLAAALVALLA
ncbi:LPS biosynthesis glycosyltransferase [Sphingomonas sp. BK580]|uniref:LPS biosynthesis glycosyltransferase n=1 Tax=Sphingomonas sp. BK580 TaxID=2586972 RepID=UPI00161DDEB3|nr:LPS biosynthesis glycosyltransferase [Sphingomonas sp. BK580]MBB3694682.1 glycosyl transferase family 25 [Sphingomonas sp. BK580]